MKEHRDEYLSIFNQNSDERQRSDSQKHSKFLSDMERTQQYVANFEKKLMQDNEMRSKIDDDFKKYVDSKFINLLDQMKAD